jgi:predicted AlkP superfamily pyrophosphatase or phosphodiesterase
MAIPKVLACVLLAVGAPVLDGFAPGGRALGAQAPAAAERPTLVVVLTVDQMRGDYLERFGAHLQGGLGRLVREGAVFTNAHQDHAITETAPGHASILSGRFPRSTGIMANLVGAGDPSVRLLGSTGPGASPARFRGSTLADWMMRHDARTRVLSVAGKDRGAILPVGRARASVFWYADDGIFTTSSWYADTLPGWVRKFNAASPARAYAGRSWSPVLPDSAYPEPDSSMFESWGRSATFPHQLATNETHAAANLRGFPFLDELTLDFALAGARAMQLGRGPATDLLAVSLSATDAIGHRFGPDSREIHDQVVRLDRRIGQFLDSLFAQVDPGRVVVALTGDHGVSPFVETTYTEGAPMATYVDASPALHEARMLLRRSRVDTLAVAFDYGLLLMDAKGLRRLGVSPTSVVERFSEEVMRIPGVMRVDRVASLEKLARGGDAIARRWLHTLPPGISAEAVVTLTPHSVWGDQLMAIHGSPHEYDTNVPLVLWGSGIRAGRSDAFVRVVDLAPTLARLVGVEPAERIDGVPLEGALEDALADHGH